MDGCARSPVISSAPVLHLSRRRLAGVRRVSWRRSRETCLLIEGRCTVELQDSLGRGRYHAIRPRQRRRGPLSSPVVVTRTSGIHVFHIRLFGGLELSTDQGRRILLPGPTSRTLLAFLALEPGRQFRRDVLAGRLWGDRTDRAAQKTLRNGLWRLRRALGRESDELVSVAGCHVGLTGAVWIDVLEFEQAVSGLPSVVGATLSAHDVERLEAARALYRGDLLAEIYDDWSDGPRERLRREAQSALERLLVHYRAVGDFHTAVARGRQLLHINPFLEHVHRELMRCHWAIGDRPLAVRQYHACEEVLRRELDLEPMAETRDLLERIQEGALPRVERGWRTPRPGQRPASVPGTSSTSSSDTRAH